MSFIPGLYNRLRLASNASPAFAGFIRSSASMSGQLPILGLQVLMSGAAAPPHERGKAVLEAVGGWWATTAFLSPTKQMAWGMLMGLSPSFSSMARSVVQGHRSSVEQRTMAAIPFSYTSVNMDQAMVTLSSVRERMSMMSYGSKSRVAEQMKVGSEAQMYSSRYLSR